jgi:hypothetical protein
VAIGGIAIVLYLSTLMQPREAPASPSPSGAVDPHQPPAAASLQPPLAATAADAVSKPPPPPRMTMASVASAMLRLTDIYSTVHIVNDGEVIVKRTTPLGGACSWVALGCIIALALNMIIDNARSNVLTQSAILPLESSTISYAHGLSDSPTATVLDWPPVPGLMLVVIGEGQASGDCALPSDAGVSGLLFGASTLQSLSLGASHINALSCVGCLFGPAAVVSTRLSYACQNIAVGLATVDARGVAQLIAINATAAPGLLLSGITWTVNPVIEVSRGSNFVYNAVQSLYSTLELSTYVFLSVFKSQWQSRFRM